MRLLTKKKKDQPNIVLDKNNIKISDPLSIQYSVFDKYVKKLQSPDSFFISPVTRVEVLKIFKSLNHSKSTGHSKSKCQ